MTWIIDSKDSILTLYTYSLGIMDKKQDLLCISHRENYQQCSNIESERIYNKKTQIILTIISIHANKMCREARKACVEQVVDIFMVLELTFAASNKTHIFIINELN